MKEYSKHLLKMEQRGNKPREKLDDEVTDYILSYTAEGRKKY